MRYYEFAKIKENATAGSTSFGNIATVISSIPKKVKPKKKSAIVIRKDSICVNQSLHK